MNIRTFALRRIQFRVRQNLVPQDPYLATLISEARSAFRAHKYDLAIGLLTDERLEEQRTLDQ